MKTHILRVAGLVACAALVPAGAGAQDFYKGKQVTVFVGYPPGGGYDTNARTCRT
jgi:tripartite-type tricarboxylate transporter receptor subunit TctC